MEMALPFGTVSQYARTDHITAGRTHDRVVLAAHRGVAARLPDGEGAASDANDLVEVFDVDERSGERRNPGNRASLHERIAH